AAAGAPGCAGGCPPGPGCRYRPDRRLRRHGPGGLPRVPGERERGGRRLPGRSRSRPDADPDRRRSGPGPEPSRRDGRGRVRVPPGRAGERALGEPADGQARLPLHDRLPAGSGRPAPRRDLIAASRHPPAPLPAGSLPPRGGRGRPPPATPGPPPPPPPAPRPPRPARAPGPPPPPPGCAPPPPPP